MLQDIHGLSVHFMLDLDGTIYQTLDVKEGAWHATVANGRSIGIEIANIGAYPPVTAEPAGSLVPGRGRGAGPDRRPRSSGTIGLHDRTAGLASRATSRSIGTVQGQSLRQYDFTDRQYESLIRLTATLCTLFPRIRCDYPRDACRGPRPGQASRSPSWCVTRASWGISTCRPTRSIQVRRSSGTGPSRELVT